jgi:hypothetical protein
MKIKALIVIAVVLFVAFPYGAQEAFTPTLPDSGDVALEAFELAGIILGAFLGGGATIAGIFVITIRFITHSPVIMRFVERAFDSWPEETQLVVRELVKFADEATDGEPTE